MRFEFQSGESDGDQLSLRFEDGRHLVTVWIATPPEGPILPVGLEVRRQSRHDHGVLRPISGSAVARLPLGTIIRAALAYAATSKASPTAGAVRSGMKAMSERDEWADPSSYGSTGSPISPAAYVAAYGAASRILMPRGPSDHRRLLDAYRALQRSGERAPANVLAERLSVNPNTIHQRLHRARGLEAQGKLPPDDKRRGKR
jgi:hypothetical protein